MRMTEYEWFLKNEFGPTLRGDTPRTRVTKLTYRISYPMTDDEWGDIRREAVKDLNGYDTGLLGKGLTTFESCLHAFENAYSKGYTFEGFDLWAIFGKMEKSVWKKKREYRDRDEMPMHYFHLLLNTEGDNPKSYRTAGSDRQQVNRKRRR